MGMDILEEKYEFLKWNWLLSFLRGSAEGAVTTATRESPFVAKTAVRDTPFLGGKGGGMSRKKCAQTWLHCPEWVDLLVQVEAFRKQSE